MESQNDSDWEFEEDENDILFTKATQQVQKTHDKILPHDLLQLYALFKQATVGKCDTPKPGIFNMQGRAKWCAWQDLADMPSDFAKQRYIEKVREVDPEWYENIQQSGHTGGSGAGNFGGTGWVVHSVEMPPEDMHYHKPDHEKTIFDFVKDRNVLMVKALLKESDLYALDESGLGLIHWATDANDLDMLSLLLSSGCPVDLRDADQQQTALHYAASCGHLECVRLLLQYGADRMAKDVEDQTCIDVADDPAIRSILESSMVTVV